MKGRGSRGRPISTLVSMATILLGCVTVHAAVTLVGPPILVAGSGGDHAAVAYNPFSNQYLVLWVQRSGGQLKGHRLDADSGALLGSEFYVSPDPATFQALIGKGTYNPTNHEWFIAYQCIPSESAPADIYGQRISSAGEKIGGPIPLVAKAIAQNSAGVACNPATGRYLVIWQEWTTNVQIWCRLFEPSGDPVSGSANLRLSEVDDRSKFGPFVTYNPVANEFMVIWEDFRNWPGSGQDNNYADVYGQRVNSTTGAKIGANIPIYALVGPPYTQTGQDIPGGIAVNSQDGGYAIGVQKYKNDLYTTVGLVTNSVGSLVAPVFNLSPPTYGASAKPAYNPTLNTYFFSYSTGDVVGNEVSADGVVLGPAETIFVTTGSMRSHALTIRPGDGQYLQVAINDSGGAVYAQRFNTGPDITPPGPVTGFTATPGYNKVTLAWTNPAHTDFTGIMIRVSTTGAPPATPSDGTLVTDEAGTPAAGDSFVHTNLSASTTYYYAAFAHDGTPNYSPRAAASAQPRYPGDFDNDRDVDQEDFGHLQVCLGGQGVIPPPDCAGADLNDTNDVDSADLQVFCSCLAGANQTPGC